MGYMTYPGYYGFSIGSTVIWLLMLLFKIFAVALVVAVVIGIFMWVRNNYFNDNSPGINSQKAKAEQTRKDTPMLKTVAVVGAVIIGIILIFALFNMFSWYGMGYGGYMGGMGTDFGYSPIYSISGILMMIIKILIGVLVISLILGAITLIKEQYDSGKFNFFGSGVKEEDSSEPTNENTEKA